MLSKETIGRMRAALAKAKRSKEILGVISAQEEVITRYSRAFQSAEILDLSEEVLRSFLYFENNKHWTGLNRQVNRICANMTATRAALSDLVDEAQPLETRMDPASSIKGMGKGIITALLHVAYPDRYGVWNNTSDAGLVAMGLMPKFDRGTRLGERYAAVNDVLRAIAEAIDVDLWTLDTVWWSLLAEESEDDGVSTDDLDSPSSFGAPGRDRSFVLERHLHDYLFDHWDNLSLAAEWAIFSQPGDPEAGYEFSTPIGRIDLLARHRTEPRWLVIELKRRNSSDQVVGQVLRYMGWIKAHHAAGDEKVEGLIIASEGDRPLHYAVSTMPNLTFMSYNVEFQLRDGPTFEEYAHP